MLNLWRPQGHLQRAVLPWALLCALSGCSAIGPTGTNTFKFPYPTKEENGKIVLTFPAPEDAKKATFVVRNKPDTEDLQFKDPIPDENPDASGPFPLCDSDETGVFCVELDPKDLPANIYLVDVFIDDEEEKSAGTVAFVTDGPAEDETASGAS
ncbi:MAG: hypothetical protein VKP62_04300 [Candidatus Sericytochromatia bacterium]|nr:hypothetical protein [Candidatus Sericytochromatia bacterium]